VDLKARRVLGSLVPLLRYLRSARPTALLSSFHHANVLALVARRLAGVRTRIVVRAQDMGVSVARADKRTFGRAIAWLAPKVYLQADAIVAVSRGVAEELYRAEARLRERTRVIFNPVVSDELFAQARQSPAHQWFLEPVPIVVAVGRLAAAKDYGTLLRAFAQVLQRQDARLLILGEGDEREYLERLAGDLGIGDAVAMPGFAENPFAAVARARVFVLSSCTEGLPNALVQALALGARIVATDCPSGPREILQDGRFGRLVPVSDVDGLARAVIAALQDPAPSIPEEAIGPFRVDDVSRQYLALLEHGTC
jgi:glycosyltransferase involved in cell wall biosynthesis